MRPDPDRGEINPRISVQVLAEFHDLVSDRWLERVADLTLSAESEGGQERAGSQQIEVVVADDDTVRDLNMRFRGLDETTDVLSFSYDHPGEYFGTDGPPSELPQESGFVMLPGTDESPSELPAESGFVMPPGTGPGLGEVVISYPQAARQAESSGRTTRHELAHLLAHGVLHLLGYDHRDPDEESAMRAIETVVLARALEHE